MKVKSLIILFCIVSGVIFAQNKEIILIHTNDTHSQLEPVKGSDGVERGGVLWRDAAIEQIRQANENVILVDAGDFVQGTPYYNLFGGEIEVKMMNELGYDVATLGNHEFDNGVDALAEMLKNANFEVVCANYDVTGTPLEPYIKKSTIIEKDGIKVGFTGVGVDPDGLIAKVNFKGIKYLDPFISVNDEAKKLKEAKCDYIVVVSHLGYFEDDRVVGDRRLAMESDKVDLIIGGHTHKQFDGCIEVDNMNGVKVKIVQNANRALKIGAVTVEFEK